MNSVSTLLNKGGIACRRPTLLRTSISAKQTQTLTSTLLQPCTSRAEARVGGNSAGKASEQHALLHGCSQASSSASKLIRCQRKLQKPKHATAMFMLVNAPSPLECHLTKLGQAKVSLVKSRWAGNLSLERLWVTALLLLTGACRPWPFSIAAGLSKPKGERKCAAATGASGVSLYFCFQDRLAVNCVGTFAAILYTRLFGRDQIELMLQNKKAEKHDRVRWVRTCFSRDHGTDFLLLQSVAGKDFSESRGGELFTFSSVCCGKTIA